MLSTSRAMTAAVCTFSEVYALLELMRCAHFVRLHIVALYTYTRVSSLLLELLYASLFI
jgi:hypothetical protein